MATAVVTGAARGLGLAIAERLVDRGFEVFVADRDAEALAGACEQLSERGGSVHAAALDVRDEPACRELAARAGRGGDLEVWVNNAGILRTGPSWSHPREEREAIFAVNTLGTIHGTLAALDPMRRRGRGHIVNVVSLAGLGTPPGETVYAASKHAAISFTLGTLADLRAAGVDGIHLSALCPDGIWTPMLFDKLDDTDAAPSFSGTLLTPERVAAAAVSLLDRPRPVLAVPRRRGIAVRLLDAFPGLASRGTRLWLADARRRQRRWKRRLASGRRPGG